MLVTTKSGKILIAACLFFVIVILCAAAIPRIVEGRRVNSLPSVSQAFSNSEISYKDWDSLKASFKKRHDEVSGFLRRAEKLEESYPRDSVLADKIESYKRYLSSMNEASFDCPEHHNMGTTTCPKCEGSGKGKGWNDWGKCNECGGSGESTGRKKCPHCGSTGHPAKISGKELLGGVNK